MIAKASGQPAPQYITGLIRELGLAEHVVPVRRRAARAVPARLPRLCASPPPAGGYRDVTASNPAVAGTAGAMVSTVPDMTRYAAQLATGAGLSPETAAARQAFTPLTSTGIRLQYGLGVTQLGDWVGHDGSIFGYSNMVWYLPREGATVVVAGNVADAMSAPSRRCGTGRQDPLPGHPPVLGLARCPAAHRR